MQCSAPQQAGPSACLLHPPPTHPSTPQRHHILQLHWPPWFVCNLRTAGRHALCSACAATGQLPASAAAAMPSPQHAACSLPPPAGVPCAPGAGGPPPSPPAHSCHGRAQNLPPQQRHGGPHRCGLGRREAAQQAVGAWVGLGSPQPLTCAGCNYGVCPGRWLCRMHHLHLLSARRSEEGPVSLHPLPMAVLLHAPSSATDLIACSGSPNPCSFCMCLC
jgi:hypothetical protein